MMSFVINLKSLFRFLLLDAFYLDNRIKLLNRRVKLSSEEMEKLQNDLLLKSLIAATKNIAAYQHLELPSSSENIKKYISTHCPVVKKTDLLNNRGLFYPNSGEANFLQIVGKSSGTTGTPLEIFRSYNSILWENSFVKRHWQNHCKKKNIKRVTLRGDQVVVDKQSNKYWFYNKFESQLVLSSRHLTKETCEEFIAIINQFNPDMLQAYPSTAFQLAQYADTNKLNINIPFVFTGSEMLYGYQRELIERTIGEVCDFYGMAERVAMATECHFKNLHVNSDYSYVEILDENDKPTDKEGYIVGTTLHNSVMPLIRYKLSDRTKWKKGKCKCGSNYPMIEPIAGKFEDILFDMNKNPISPSLITFAFKGVSNIEKSQVAQTDVGKWIVRIVPTEQYQKEDGEQIRTNLLSLVSKDVKVKIEIVRDISKTKAGKFRWVVNEMSKSSNDKTVEESSNE
jgi:phenylacetate-CoA ligase